VIHGTAIVHPKARLAPSVQVGPFSIIDEGVEVGPGCLIGPRVYITGATVIGSQNQFFAGCVIGEAPQDLKYKGEHTRMRIGDRNVFRENVTVHRSSKPSEETIIGSDNYLMANSHVGHNCHLGDFVVMANGALLGGHAEISDRAFISGNCLVHQFTRVGTLAIMQGGSAISKDLPPYTIARGYNGICGLNVVGLRRAGMSAEDRNELKQLYHALFRNGMKLRSAVAAALKSFSSPPAKVMLGFLESATRGVCSDTGKGRDSNDLD
jgi:UDP-N-acetylglucosamine acyltransferase